MATTYPSGCYNTFSFSNVMQHSSVGISFVVASYNISASIVNCVKSIQAQSLRNIEIIIVNDKSTDNTLDIAQQLCEEDSLKRTICVSHLRNRGLAAARNTGLYAASHSHIWHMDGDDYLPGVDVAKKIMDAVKKHGILAVKIPVFEESDDRPFSSEYFSNTEIYKFECKVVKPSAVSKRQDIEGAFSIIYDKQFAMALNIRSLEGVSIGEGQILISQLLKKLPCLGLVNIPMYVSTRRKSSMIGEKWTLQQFLEDRIHFYFLCLSLADQPALLINVFNDRVTYIANKLIPQARNNLDNNNFELLVRCWKYDCKVNKLRKSLRFIETVDFPFNSYLSHAENFDVHKIFSLIFSNAEIVIHCGAHKTATTFTQGKLNVHRYDLAIEGIFYIDYLQFRKNLEVKGELHSSESTMRLKKSLINLVIPLLFRLPKKIIISDENIIANGDAKYGFNSVFACHKNGFNTVLLEKLLGVFNPSNVSVFYSIRNYNDFIKSNYCEKIKWRKFSSFDEYTTLLYSDTKSISWGYICDKLRALQAAFSLKSVNILKFEDFKSDPLKLVSLLTGKNMLKRSNEEQDSSIESILRRSSPTQESVDLSMNAIHRLGERSAQLLYKKLVVFGYGNSKYNPKIDEQIFSLLNSKYHDDCNNMNVTSSVDYVNTASMKKLSTKFLALSGSVSSAVQTMNNFLDNKPEDVDFSIDSWKRIFTKHSCLTNIENISEFNIRTSGLPKINHGISAMLRVKNEAINIKKVIQCCLRVFDEVVVIDNNSSDQTVEIVESFKDEIPADQGSKIKIYHYAFDVRKCGQENFDCDENSTHSLAYFYNFAMSKCSFSHIFKWDGDMILIDSMVNHFLDFKRHYFEQVNANDEDLVIHGVPKGVTIYKGFNGRFYYQPNVFEQEVRLFPNSSSNFFVKSVLWEMLYSPFPARLINSDRCVFVEFKDVTQDEFSHWKIGGLGMGMRKRNELSCFNQIASLTKHGTPAKSDLEKAGFIEIENLDDFLMTSYKI